MDANAGNYHKIYKSEFGLAKSILEDEGGHIEWGTNDYEAFLFTKPGVSLVFYPHRTTARHYHIRVRDRNSKDKAEVLRLMAKLEEAGNFPRNRSIKNWRDNILADRYISGRRDAAEGIFNPPHYDSADPQDEDETHAYRQGFDERRRELGNAFKWA